MGTGSEAMHRVEARIAELERKHTEMAETHRALKASMDGNTVALQEFIDLGKNLKFGMKLLGVIESIAVWITKVSLAVGTLWAIYKYGVLEAIRHVKS